MPFQKYSIEKDELVNLFQKWRHLLILWKENIFTYVLGMWHSFFQLWVGGYDLLLAGCDLCYLGVSGCGWVWPFLAGCGWVWVSAGGCGWVHGLYRFVQQLADDFISHVRLKDFDIYYFKFVSLSQDLLIII